MILRSYKRTQSAGSVEWSTAYSVGHWNCPRHCKLWHKTESCPFVTSLCRFSCCLPLLNNGNSNNWSSNSEIYNVKETPLPESSSKVLIHTTKSHNQARLKMCMKYQTQACCGHLLPFQLVACAANSSGHVCHLRTQHRYVDHLCPQCLCFACAGLLLLLLATIVCFLLFDKCFGQVWPVVFLMVAYLLYLDYFNQLWSSPMNWLA